MNEQSQLEKQLGSWIPRRPSAKLKTRIFPATPARIGAATVAEPISATPGWFLFAPAACIFLLAILFCAGRHDNRGYLAMAGGSNVLASLSSNLLAQCATDLQGQNENVWRAVTFDWTKDSHSLSTTGSFPLLGKTNVQKL